MKSYKSALLLMVCLALAGNVPAQARPASYFGTTSSFKSGFSSQKSNSAAHSRPAPPAANRQSGPGAFGRQAGSPASAQPSRNTSAMSRDIDQSAARDNALRTLDQRRAASATPLPPVNDPVRQPSQPQPQPYYGAPPYAGPAPVYAPPAQSSGLMHGLIGFMLGRAMSQSHQPVAYPTTSGGQPAPAAGNPASTTSDQVPATTAAQDGGLVGGMPGLAAPAPAAVPAPAPQPSFAASVLRWFAWLAVLSLLIWAAVYSVRKLRRLRATPNYSFERN